jgi:hypothetical protein
MERKACPQCGMSMIVTGNGRGGAQRIRECLRCGHMEPERGMSLPFRPRLTDAEQAKRFRDKAAEAEQMAELATSQLRREVLFSIEADYRRTAEQLEQIAGRS